MLHAVSLFGGLRIVPVIHRANQITGDSPDSFKRHVLEPIVQISIVAVDVDVECFKFAVIFIF